MRYKHTKEELEEVIKKSLSISEVCKNLGIIAAGGNYKTLQNKIKLFNIDTSHFNGQGWNTGTRYRKVVSPIPIEKILIKGSNYGSSKLKKRLFDSKLKNKVCECCDLTEWMGTPISLELHHMNGDSNDNRLENLQILCPNCHSMTDNYRGKNIKTIKTEISAECLHCGCEYTGNSKKYCSVDCYDNWRKINNTIPKVPELLESFKTYKSFMSVGRHYNVSDNAVRKWCNNYGIMEMIKKGTE